LTAGVGERRGAYRAEPFAAIVSIKTILVAIAFAAGSAGHGAFITMAITSAYGALAFHAEFSVRAIAANTPTAVIAA